jgi:hypothetical protein
MAKPRNVTPATPPPAQPDAMAGMQAMPGGLGAPEVPAGASSLAGLLGSEYDSHGATPYGAFPADFPVDTATGAGQSEGALHAAAVDVNDSTGGTVGWGAMGGRLRGCGALRTTTPR